MSGVMFVSDNSEAFGLMGFTAGLSETVQTDAYINSVLKLTHAKLSMFFDEWLDGEAKARPTELSHVYEWPEEYGSLDTVGEPSARLWRHVLVGSARAATATFEFLESKVPTPVNPILADEGVKEGVHIFHFKAEAFEYGIPITVEPKLAQYLAYVIDGANHSGGNDEDPNRFTKNEAVMLSKGPVHFIAGGGKFALQFTTAYVKWWQTMAGNVFNTEIRPTLQQELTDAARYEKAIKLGKRSTSKSFNITAQASLDAQTFAEARAAGEAYVLAKASDHIITAAALRSAALYGE